MGSARSAIDSMTLRETSAPVPPALGHVTCKCRITRLGKGSAPNRNPIAVLQRRGRCRRTSPEITLAAPVIDNLADNAWIRSHSRRLLEPIAPRGRCTKSLALNTITPPTPDPPSVVKYLRRPAEAPSLLALDGPAQTAIRTGSNRRKLAAASKVDLQWPVFSCGGDRRRPTYPRPSSAVDLSAAY